MQIGIHPDQTGDESYSTKFTEYFTQQDIKVKLLDLLREDAIEQARDCNGVIWRWLHRPSDKQSAKQILYTIEHGLSIPVFPNSVTSWHYDDKIAQYYLLTALGAPVIKTWVFWDYQEALQWVKQASFPLVFKLSSGAGAANVIKIKSKDQATELVIAMFRKGIFPYTHNEYRQTGNWNTTYKRAKSHLRNGLKFLIKSTYPPLHKVWWKPEYGYAYFQEFLPNNDYDTRVTVIGNRAFAFKRYNRPGDFRASGSGSIDTSPNNIDLTFVKIALEVSQKAGFQSIAYDFLYDTDGQAVIGEISYTFADWAVQKCPGYWDENLHWIKGNIWPEYAIGEDFLKELAKRKAKLHL